MLDPKLVQQEIKEAPSEEARLALLLDRSMTGYRSHPKEAKKWAEEARKLAKKLRRPIDEARALFRIGCADVQVAKFQDARRVLEQSVELFKSAEQEQGGHADAPLLMLGEIERMTGNLREARRIYEEVYHLRSGRDNQTEVATSLALLAQQSGEYALALRYLFEALDVMNDRAASDSPSDLLRMAARGIVVSNIGGVYLEVHDYDRARSYYEQALALSRQAGDEATTATVLVNLATIASETRDFRAAHEWANSAATMLDKEHCRWVAVHAIGILGDIAKHEGNTELALQEFARARSAAEDLGLAAFAHEAGLGYAELLVESGHEAEAIALLEEIVVYTKTSGQQPLTSRALAALAKAYQSKGNLKASVEQYEAHLALSRELYSQERLRAIIELQAKVEIAELEKERARMERAAQDASQRAALLQQEREQQSKELTALALELVKKNEFLCDLREKIEGSSAVAGVDSRSSKELLTQIDDHIRSDQDWNIFENQLDRVHADFLRRLSSQYPTLTPMELKTAALMKLNLSSKQIANLFCLSVRTVENHRLNLRRKLGLGAEDNLMSFLSGL